MSEQITAAEFEARLDWLSGEYEAPRAISDGRYNSPNRGALLTTLSQIQTAAYECEMYLKANPDPMPWQKPVRQPESEGSAIR